MYGPLYKYPLLKWKILYFHPLLKNKPVFCIFLVRVYVHVRFHVHVYVSIKTFFFDGITPDVLPSVPLYM